MTPSCSPADVLGTCQCVNVSTTVKKVTTVTQYCNCTGVLKSDKAVTLRNEQNIVVAPSQCGGSYNELGLTYSKCCLKEATFSTPSAKTCRTAD